MRNLILYIAASLDGYIAAPGDDLSFLSSVEQPGQDYGYADFIDTIDTVIIGRRTYDWVMKHVPQFVHDDKKTYVITRTDRPAIGNTEFYTGDLNQLLSKLRSVPGKNIFCDGGAEVVHEFLKEDLVDEFIISIVPILLGDGIRLFKDGRPSIKLQLKQSLSFEKGLVQLHYNRNK